jgi:hypothetical protein
VLIIYHKTAEGNQLKQVLIITPVLKVFWQYRDLSESQAILFLQPQYLDNNTGMDIPQQCRQLKEKYGVFHATECLFRFYLFGNILYDPPF